jgi:5-methylcytosine-specific restriction endonuclease McrA
MSDSTRALGAGQSASGSNRPDVTDPYHPVTPDAPRPRECPACHAWGNSPCLRPDGTPRGHHRSRGRQRVLTTSGIQKRKSKGAPNAGSKRATIAARDGAACWICGLALLLTWDGRGPMPGNYATLDHVIPRSQGGGNAVGNLRLACRLCNLQRGVTPADEVRTWRSLASVEQWGGVLEHPAQSSAWIAFNLPRPLTSGGWVRNLYRPGWACHVEQGNYGHEAPKATWLYYVGTEPPPLRWGKADLPIIDSCPSVGRTRGRTVEVMTRRERRATPPEFCELLLTLARGSRS